MDGWAPAGFEDVVEIGRGGFGTVCRARDQVLGRVVAIKRLDAHLDESGRQRFAREGRVMGRLSNHPNVVPVYGSGVDERGPYLVMPYLSRGSLADGVRQRPLGWDEAVRVMIRLTGAVESAHRSGVLHRDIKPDNILLSDFGEPQLTDFGIARMSGEWATTDGQVAGSLPYTAPEILTGAEPSVRSDVYALGATLHHLLSGRAPFTDERDSSIWPLYHRIGNDPVPPLAHVPPPLDRLVRSAMAKSPDERPPSADAFGRALQEVQRATAQPVVDMAVMATDDDPAGTRGIGAPLPPATGPFGATSAIPGAPPAPPPGKAASRRWLAAAGIIAVLVLAAAAGALSRGRDAVDASPNPIGLDGASTPAAGAARGGEPGPPPTDPDGAIDITPGATPVPVTDTGTSIPVRIAAYSNVRLRVASVPGRRALARIEMTDDAKANLMTISLERDREALTNTTITGGPELTVGPVRMGSEGRYSVLIGSPKAIDITITVRLAPPDATLTATVGAPPSPITLIPFQTGVLSFTGTAGQRVRGHWLGDISEGNDLVMLDPRGEQLADWSGSDDDLSDVVTLAAAGTYTIEVEPDEGEARAGRLSVERG